VSRARVLRMFGLAVGVALLVEGGALLVLEASRVSLPFATGDVRHNALHVVWGAAILYLLIADRTAERAIAVMGVFGVFYTLLAVLGVVSDHPLGLALGPGENAFHFIVGPLSLLLSVWTAVQVRSSDSSSSASSAASVSSPAAGATSTPDGGGSPR
jgi:hypothetical protein